MEYDFLKTEVTEDKEANSLINVLDRVLSRGYLMKDEFLSIANWKSHRQARQYEKNSAEYIQEVTGLAFGQKNEKLKMHILTALDGVSIPVASAILALTDPQNYGVIDIRAWQTLSEFGMVSGCESGVGLSEDNWVEYLGCIRKIAKENNMTAREIDLKLFWYHKNELQEGNLYR